MAVRLCLVQSLIKVIEGYTHSSPSTFPKHVNMSVTVSCFKSLQKIESKNELYLSFYTC